MCMRVCRDIVVALDVGYPACVSTLDYVCQRYGARMVLVKVPIPLDEDALVAVRACVFDSCGRSCTSA